METSDLVGDHTMSAASASYHSRQGQPSQSGVSRQTLHPDHTENIFAFGLGKIALTTAIAELARNAQSQNLMLTYEALIVAHNVLLFEIKKEF